LIFLRITVNDQAVSFELLGKHSELHVISNDYRAVEGMLKDLGIALAPGNVLSHFLPTQDPLR
jgi:hypothetical protein